MDFIIHIIASFFGALIATGGALMIVDRKAAKAKKEKK